MIRNWPFLALVMATCLLVAAQDDPWFGKKADLGVIQNTSHVSIVFAGENLRSPISLFGHTFLVFHNNAEPEPDSLVVEYLAKSPDGFFETLAGGFLTLPGGLHLTRFLYKKREYDLEDRDLWVFTLMNTKVQRPQIIQRLKASLERPDNYNFFGRNCAFHVLRLLVGDALNGYSSTRLYTIPISTIQDLQHHGWIESVQFLPSTASLLHASVAKLGSSEKSTVIQLLNGYGLALKSNSFSEPNFSQALALAINYRLPREPRADIRTHLFDLKKQYPATPLNLSTAAPSIRRRIAYLQLAFQPPDQYFTLTLRPAFQDFYSLLPGPLDFSTLDLLRVQAATDRQTVALSEFNFFKMESLISSQFLVSGFVRYIDLSFYDWTFRHSGKSEAALRVGLGWSKRLSRTIQFAIVPFIGGRGFNDSGLRVGGTLAVRSHVQLQITPRSRVKAIYQFEPFSPIGFNHLLQIDLVPYEMQTWGLLGSLSYADTLTKALRVTVGVTIFF